MKIAITGHKKGIGKAFAEQLLERGHEIVGISRSDGENIRRTAHTASLIEPCDMLINNAISFYESIQVNNANFTHNKLGKINIIDFFYLYMLYLTQQNLALF